MPEGQGLALSADNREAADSAVGACRQRVRSSKRACSVMLLEQQGQPRRRARPSCQAAAAVARVRRQQLLGSVVAA
eukprot:SAG25_NODE_48_length_18937_cov_1106.642637_9_plen_76_part_00